MTPLPDLTPAEVAAAIGVSAGSARRHLDLMIAEGLIDDPPFIQVSMKTAMPSLYQRGVLKRGMVR